MNEQLIPYSLPTLMPHYPEDLENIEIRLLLEGVYQYYGFDLRNYAFETLKYRMWNLIQAENLASVSDLQKKVLHDSSYKERFLLELAVNASSMFSDPNFFIAFRNQVIPFLKTYPSIRIWYAGCATGEEVYSLAILLLEEGIYNRCRIYATDASETALNKAKAGVISLESMQKYAQLYLESGGKKSLSDYYTAIYDNAVLRSFLKKNIVFLPHNLVTDSSFNEFNVILCRNVLNDFNSQLQRRVHQLLYDSLGMFGVLGLGPHETLKMTPYEHCYEKLIGQENLYRRVV